jgi:ribosomal-protein-alanine N-acetyltransferase
MSHGPTDSIYLRALELDDAPALLALRQRNRDFFRPFEPIQTERHFTLEGQWDEIALCAEDAQRDRRYVFGIFVPPDVIVGRIALSNIARGAWQNATVGYYVDGACGGRGYATQALRLTVRFAFRDVSLHRLQGAALPDNAASARVMIKAGFRHEGLALRYININGEWRDHLLFALTWEEWEVGGG